MKDGYLKADRTGEYQLWRRAGAEWERVPGYRPTNALLPAISRARELGYEPENI